MTTTRTIALFQIGEDMPPTGEFKPASCVCRASALTPSGTGTRPCALSLSGRGLRIPSGQTIAFPRRDAPELCACHPRNKRGCRECRMRAAPAVSCAKLCEETHTSIQVQRRQSGIPCAMALRLISRSPRRRIRLVTVIGGLKVLSRPVGPEKTSADLTPATGVRTTRFCRTRSAFAKGFGGQARRNFQHRRKQRRSSCARSFTHGSRPVNSLRADAVASTTSHPAFVTIAIRPSCRERTGRAGSADLPDGTSGIFSYVGLDTQITDLPVGLFFAERGRGRLPECHLMAPEAGVGPR
jgi:hypothetical protein